AGELIFRKSVAFPYRSLGPELAETAGDENGPAEYLSAIRRRGKFNFNASPSRNIDVPPPVRILLACILALSGFARSQAADPSAEGIIYFEKQIRPVLVERCYQCHSAAVDKPKGGLRLDDRAALLRGGNHGPVLVPGKPDKSRLIQA